MVDPSWSSREYNNVFGALTKPDQGDVPLPYSTIARNCAFYNIPGDETRGGPGHRYGFGSTGVPTTAAHHSLFDWITSSWHHIVFAGASAISIYGMDGASVASLSLSNSASGVQFARGGNRLFLSFFNSSGYGERQGYAITKDSGGTFRLDKLFPPPLSYAPSAPTEPGAGVVTAGLHRFGYIIEYRSGFFGRLQPDSGSGTPGIDETFVPVEKTAAGSANLSWTLNTTWPADAVRVHVAMTPVSNPNLFILVPGAKATVTAGGASSHAITININDADLLATLETGDVTENRLLYTQVAAGTGPFHPSSVFDYGDRMVYVTRIADTQGNLESAVFASARLKYQHVTLARHKLQTANAPDLRTGFVLNKRLFLLSPNATFATRDAVGTEPVEWPTLIQVNGQRGCEAVNGIAVNPDEGYAWVPNRAGLFYFDGANYSADAITDGVEEWDQIVWSRAQEIVTVDDPANQRVFCAVPLNATVGDLTILCISYRRGKHPQKTDFSKWTVGSFKVGSIAMAVDEWNASATEMKGRMELCLLSGAAATRRVLRQKGADDTNPFRDYQTDSTEASIDWLLRLAPFRDGRSTQVLYHAAAHIRTFGSGALILKAYSLDGRREYLLSPLTLEAQPGREILRAIDKWEDGLMLEFSTTQLDANCTIGGFRYYFKSGWGHR